jgi:spore coat protein U-like protein
MLPQPNSRLRRRPLLAVVAAGALLPLPVLAATCTVDTSGAAIAFGTYDPLAVSPMPALGAIRVICEPPNANNLQVIFSLGPGDHSANFSPRRMQAGPGNYLGYNLYTTGAYATVFGDGTSGTQTVTRFTSAIGGGQFRATAQVFGRLPAGQNAAAGLYSDTILVTVTY